MIRRGSRSFFVASIFLPARMRRAAYAVYAFCRLSDDAVDVEGGRLPALDRLRVRLDRIHAGEPELHPVDRALADAVAHFRIPKAAMDALLEGLEWDVQGRTYETISDLFDYAARVAGSVGAVMSTLMDARSTEMVARACDLGVAMQLTNIARDVGEDAAVGRIYLPREWLREAGLDPDAWLANPRFCGGIATVVARLLRAADELYGRADAGIAHLGASYRPAIFAARYLYADIGACLRDRGFDSVSARTRVPAARKIGVLAKAASAALQPPSGDIFTPALPQTRFLVDAVGRQEPVVGAPSRHARNFHDDLAWTIDLFARLERRHRPCASAQGSGGLT